MSAEDDSWVFDSLVAFLNGPIWNAPLQSFIEEKSLIFEPTMTENEDYKKIFEEFKNLVDFMLGNFMEDIGISSEQFEKACVEGKRYVSFNNNIFEQIWAANDQQMFVRMMTQRNVELQLQALDLIEKKYGITPQSFIPKKSEDQTERDENPNIQVIPVTVERESKLEKEILEEVAKRFVEDDAEGIEAQMEHLMEEKPILEKQLKESLEKSQRWENSEAKAKPSVPLRKSKETDPLELKKRQEYLRAQRDKLVALKKEARQKHLNDETENTVKNRPKSAKAAEAVLAGGHSDPAANQLQIRKTLAERLKAEVVEKK
ncbi:cilia- and flagella-associated protein 36 [Euwallacea fornicatus]|uniref:cilia- and flagella-associated protein 36 n=1 Tax=Euwallacea fornicatus TaxID=995702 RepID=UPI00338F8C5B